MAPAVPQHSRRRLVAAIAALPALPLQRTVIPGLSLDGPNLEVRLSDHGAYQGGAILVRVNNAGTAGRARFLGRSTALLPAAGGLAAFVGIATGDPAGLSQLAVEVDAWDGTVELRAFAIQVLKTLWTVDYIVLPPPDPNAPPEPDYPEDQPILDRVYASVTPIRWEGTWTAPLTGPLSVSGYFGEQRSFNGGPVQGHHGGTDLAADADTPVVAPNAGVVAFAGRVKTRGNLVVVDHGGGVISSYGHLADTMVSEGDALVQGGIVGHVGSTGLSTGPHLHWEMAVGGVLVDGLRWLDGSQKF